MDKLSEADLKKLNNEHMSQAGNIAINNLKLPPELKKYISYESPLCNWNYSTMRRIIRSIKPMRTRYMVNKTNIIMSCVKITQEGVSCIIGYMYSEVDGTKFTHKIITVGGTYRSQDGEYRDRVLTYDYFKDLIKANSEALQDVEDLVVSKLESGDIQFQIDICYPFETRVNKRAFEESVNTSRIAILIYTIDWFIDFHRVITKQMPNHINPAYLFIMYQPSDVVVYNVLFEKLGKAKYELINMLFESNTGSTTATRTAYIYPMVGQKIFPMTVRETVRLEDINYNIWREIYINSLCSNLVLNHITPSFPFCYSWFYIQASHAGIFDNLSMHDKFLHSEIATNIAIKLKIADKMNYIEEDPERGAINTSFDALSRGMNKSLLYIDSTIKLSDVSICAFSENVGRTLRDLPTLVNEHFFAHDIEFIFDNVEMFQRHIFDFIYAFYSMNSRVFVIHGDIHMNNATIYKTATFIQRTTEKIIISDPHIIYVIEGITYMFKHWGSYGCVIDFSRAIIGDREKINYEFGEGFAERYFTDQYNRIMDILFHYFKDVVSEHGDTIYAACHENFELVFKIISVIDTYVITSNLMGMFGLDTVFTSKKIKINKDIIHFLQQVIDMARDLMVENLGALIAGKIKKASDIQWPNLVIIQRLYKGNIMQDVNILDKPGIHIIDIFISDNEMKYDIDSDQTGPLLRDTELNETRAKWGLPPVVVAEAEDIKKIDAVVDRYDITYNGISDDTLEWMIST